MAAKISIGGVWGFGCCRAVTVMHEECKNCAGVQDLRLLLQA